ncbi:MAG: hydroxymethylglutaryl-CoA lyase [Defluviicoccus sp.]|nr:hydroxymethylglutaryl-CoA lyase [Defluviicoccus sp.]MDE0275052.1 hydroxymethylglutaryl-CoA lyase [Defluviicoccus sp.]
MPGRRIELVEVSARDGLQNEPEILSTEVKLELIRRTVAAGVRRLEAASFVNPKRVPQMADAEAVMAGLPKDDGVTYIGLVLNRRGFDRAAEAGCEEVNYALVASDAFSERNQGTTVEQGIEVLDNIVGAARDAGIRCSATISAAFGCPFQGEVRPERVHGLIAHCAGLGLFEIGIADTIGVAAPGEVAEMFAEAARLAPEARLRGHFHNTRNTGIANAFAAVEAGVHALDASIGGIGGCPFAPAATGNIPSEDLIYMLHRLGIETGIDIEALIDTALWIETQLGRAVPAMVSRAGNFPPAELRA